MVESDSIIHTGDLFLQPKLCGGKGGFGSMLRAIGAQIEKTTNREACRDLSGRRLRDINKEKRLKTWIEKQSERDEEKTEKKKKKLERLCAEPKHEFKDKSYDEKRSCLTERVEDAVSEGFAVASTSAVKRSPDPETKTNPKKKKKTIMDSDLDTDSDSASSDEEQSSDNKEISKIDSENSSDGSSSCQTNSCADEKSTSGDDSSQSKHADDTSR